MMMIMMVVIRQLQGFWWCNYEKYYIRYFDFQIDDWRWDWVEFSLTEFQESDNETLRICFHKSDFWFEVQLELWLKANGST